MDNALEFHQEFDLQKIADEQARKVQRYIDEEALKQVEDRLAEFGYVKVGKCELVDCGVCKFYHADIQLCEYGIPPCSKFERKSNEAISKEKDMEAYKERMIEEYKELKERYDKLDAITVKAEAGTLGFKLNCPLSLLLEQKRCMGEYLRCLKIRAEIEGVNING